MTSERKEGVTTKMSQRYFCPAEYTIKTKPETNQKTKSEPKPKRQLTLRVSFSFSLSSSFIKLL